jgi:hypothetical protein
MLFGQAAQEDYLADRGGAGRHPALDLSQEQAKRPTGPRLDRDCHERWATLGEAQICGLLPGGEHRRDNETIPWHNFTPVMFEGKICQLLQRRKAQMHQRARSRA